MYRVALITMALLWVSLACPFEVGCTPNMSDRVSDILRERLITTVKTEMMSPKKGCSPASTLLQRFYVLRKFRPAWISAFGIRSDAMILLKTISKSDLDSLNSEEYHVDKIDALLTQIHHKIERNRPTDPDQLADIEILLSEALLLYAYHILVGSVSRGTISSEWFFNKQVADLVELLLNSIEEAQVEDALGQMKSQNDGYWLLNRHLILYQNILKSGGWPCLTVGPDLKKGDRSLRVAMLRSRLTASGDLKERKEVGEDFFDEGLESAVSRFQNRHGLEPDGIVGQVTRSELNIPVKDRIEQIRLNMDRWRQLPTNFGWRYILVNITDFKLNVVENDKIILTMKVVVGRESRPTPVLVSRITSVELNPSWQIPVSIIRKDIMPKIIENPDYLSDANIRIFKNWEKDASEIDPKSINWMGIRPENFTYKLQQEPGPLNALGRIKFIFPNKFEVYLHDTPIRGLFQKAKRSSSSGCIRLEKPFELLKYLFRSGQGWNGEKIIAELNSGKTQILRLPESVPIYVLYWTVWVDGADILNFRDDIYGRDKPLFEAFKNTQAAIHSHKGLYR